MKAKRKKEKILKKSARERKRYLLLGKTSRDKVEKSILDYIGTLGWAKSSPMWVGDILAVNRKSLDNIRAALELIGIKVKRVSGTLKGLKK